VIIELGFSRIRADRSATCAPAGFWRRIAVWARSSPTARRVATGRIEHTQCCRFLAGEGDAAEQVHKMAALKRALAD
jgi:hypothetical protein